MPDRLLDQQHIIDEVAALRAEVTRLRERPARWRRLGALGSVLAVVGVALVASAGAAPTTDTTAVDFVTIPAKKVMSANSIPAGATESATVIGGTTTVPSNATTVRLEVTVKGTAAGIIKLFPAGNEAGGAGHTVSWAAGGTTTETEAENVGLSNKVSVRNSSTKAAVVTLTITGYSTQVTAGDINSSGGVFGQVLTDTGVGAEWRTLRLHAGDINGTGGSNGQVLTNNGDGTAAWKTPAAPPVVLKAAVNRDGGVEVGNVTAVRNAPGRYQVSFSRSMVGCAVTGSVGPYQSGSWVHDGIVSVLSGGLGSTLSVWVTKASTNEPVDSDFFLTAIC